MDNLETLEQFITTLDVTNPTEFLLFVDDEDVWVFQELYEAIKNNDTTYALPRYKDSYVDVTYMDDTRCELYVIPFK